MDEFLDALTDPEFCFFIDDYTTATEDISWGYADKPFIPTLLKVMRINGERDCDEH